MTCSEFWELKAILDQYGISYDSGEYYDTNLNGDEIIVGHWIGITGGQFFETDELSLEDRLCNDH